MQLSYILGLSGLQADFQSSVPNGHVASYEGACCGFFSITTLGGINLNWCKRLTKT